MTTGCFSGKHLLDEEQILKLPCLTNTGAIEIGQIAVTIGSRRKLPIAIEIRIGEWIVFHASLEGSKPENDWWIKRKVAVVMLTHHSTMFELYRDQINTAHAWKKSHITSCSHQSTQTFGWSFRETGIGVVISCFCTCGEEIDVTDYENW